MTTALEIQRALSVLPRKNASSFRVLRRQLSEQLKDASGRSVIALAKRLVPLGFWERAMAYEILAFHPAARRTLTPNDVTILGWGMEGWGEVDTFAGYVAGVAWRERRIPGSMVERWARSPSRWWRRAALVSTVPLNSRAHGGSGDAARTLRICRVLLRDRDEMVVKALSWALRELSKRDRRAVESFVRKYQDVLPSRVRREVRNKLETGLKNPRRAGRSPSQRR
jgi:hypothetical protein